MYSPLLYTALIVMIHFLPQLVDMFPEVSSMSELRYYFTSVWAPTVSRMHRPGGCILTDFLGDLMNVLETLTVQEVRPRWFLALLTYLYPNVYSQLLFRFHSMCRFCKWSTQAQNTGKNHALHCTFHFERALIGVLCCEQRR